MDALQTVRPRREGAATNFLTKRADGSDPRAPTQLRFLHVKTGVLNQANGSSYVELGNTKVICAIYGPRQINKSEYSDVGKLQCEVTWPPFALPDHAIRDDVPTSRTNGLKTGEEYSAEIAVRLTQALESSIILHKLPKSVVDVHVSVLQADGGVLPACITAASVAVADAGIELFDVVTACSACVRAGSDEVILLDPSLAEELDCIGQPARDAAATAGPQKTVLSPIKKAKARDDSAFVVTVACLLHRGGITQVSSRGEASPAALKKAVALCVDGCGAIGQRVDACLEASALKRKRSESKG
mmetsp:Transcript_19793/g.50293  ORF Transcript_19793/g.50293 Transcript_19793/m.50293 type:complete len:301 (-) Transcript_19793:27-929(-)|eukprot:CAMPEP_0177655524 /NCGR_PEP_ID=MMETSP0447-20121125/15021_1 /TAXON_ID=0 /ORGANISM="Stygamoeba regulata, Strain BSH-02190019" /LENGTH=300 /DNA_ID=CAMNT_0019159465 /DNA_START=41 /DNA_END=943 /DNA_ORIENTATION=-